MQTFMSTGVSNEDTQTLDTHNIDRIRDSLILLYLSTLEGLHIISPSLLTVNAHLLT